LSLTARMTAVWAAMVAGCALAQSAERPSVILVSLDQCRADRLHLDGNPRATSPNLDRMAAEGFRLTRFYAAAPWTAPSYASMMTAQHPSRHGVTVFQTGQDRGLKPDAITLAELFRKAGYKTGAFVNNGVAGAYLTRPGFDDYEQGQRTAPSITERREQPRLDFSAPATNPRVFEWIDQNRARPFFLFLLYFEPHSPYNPPPEDDLFKSDAYPAETNTGYDLVKGRLFRLANLGDRQAVERMVQLYDGKIHFIDRYVGQLLDKLRRDGLEKNVIVLLTSDHGELLYSHPSDYMTFDHRSLYEPVIHVPCLFWGAGLPRGKAVDALASHVDIAPTLLELAGLPPKPDAQGRSFVPVIQGRQKAIHRYVFCEQDILERLRSVRDDRYKLILNTESGRQQLFDYRSDPAEQRDIAASRPELVARLGSVLAQWREENEPAPEERDRRWRAHAPNKYIVDEVTTGAHFQLSGNDWKMADQKGNFGGGSYWTEAAKAGRRATAMWRSDNPMLGRYSVSIWYGGLPGGGIATDAPFIVTARKSTKTFRIDQTMQAGVWVELGIFDDPIAVTLTNEANGRVIADAVRFERVE